MKQKAQTVRLNEYVVAKIEQHKYKKKLTSFSEATNDLFTEFLKQDDDNKRIEKKVLENEEKLEEIKTILTRVVSILSYLNDNIKK